MSENKFQQLGGLVKIQNSIEGFEKYVYRGHQNCEQLFEIIKNCRVDEIGCRFNIWRMSMGVFDFRADWAQKVESLEKSRKDYEKKKNQAFGKESKAGKEAVMPKNPLMKIMSKPKQTTVNENEFLKQEIKKDVDRTHQEMDFFQNERVLKLLTNILYVWCKRYPDVSYKQGMNEVCASLLYVYFQSANYEKRRPEGFNQASEEVQEAYKLINDLHFAEADIYEVFDKVMVIQKEMYKTETDSNVKGVINPNSKNNTPILLRIIDIKDHKLKMLDLELFRVIKMQDVQTKSFMLRWIRCMHTRQFSLFNSFHIWDSIFLDYYESPGCKQKCVFEFVDSMCLAMFIYMRSVVLSRQTASEILQTYQKYPALEKGKYLQQLISLAWSVCDALRSQDNINANWYEQSDKSKKLHFMDKGQLVQLKESQQKKKKASEQEIKPRQQPLSPEKEKNSDGVKREVQSIQRSVSTKEAQMSSQQEPQQEQKNLISPQKTQPQNNEFKIHFEPHEWKLIEHNLKESIKQNQDIESRSLCSKVLRMFEAKIRQGQDKQKNGGKNKTKEPAF